jgi:hypothetical protein
MWKKSAVIVGLLVSMLSLHASGEPDPWKAFVPPPDSDYDWIQLVSGEWLKGELKAMYDHVLEFDSEELELLEFDFENVVWVRTRRPQQILVEREGNKRGVILESGVLEIDGNQVILRNGEETLELGRQQVVSIAPGLEDWRSVWSGSIAAGLTERSGNSETTDGNVNIYLQRRTGASRMTLDHASNYSESGGEKTSDNHRTRIDYDRYLSSRFYWRAVSGEYYRDPFSNIDDQYSVGTGPGYELIWTTKTEWLVFAGVGYQKTYFVSVEAGEDSSSESPFGSIGTRFDQELTSRVDLILDYSMRLLNDENGRYTHHAIGTLSVELVNDFDLDLSYVWDRIDKPQRASDGTVPEQDDFKFIVSIAYDF